MNEEISRRPWVRVVIRWAVFLIAAALTVMLAEPASIAVGKLPDGRQIVEPYPSVLLIYGVVVLVAAGMLIHDLFRSFARRR